MKLLRLIKTITARSSFKAVSTYFAVSFSESLAPMIAPPMPPNAMETKSTGWKEGTVFVRIAKRMLANWENIMMNKEFFAACLASMEKNKNRTATLLVPPPMPRKEEIQPSTVPIKNATERLSTCLEGSRSFVATYMSTIAVISVRHAACTIPSTRSFPKLPRISSNNSFPIIPPPAAPKAKGTVVFNRSVTSFFLDRIMEQQDIASTVQPDRKLAELTGSRPAASTTGLMITPPPAPTIAPMIEAPKLIKNNKIVNRYFSFQVFSACCRLNTAPHHERIGVVFRNKQPCRLHH